MAACNSPLFLLSDLSELPTMIMTIKRLKVRMNVLVLHCVPAALCPWESKSITVIAITAISAPNVVISITILLQPVVSPALNLSAQACAVSNSHKFCMSRNTAAPIMEM